MSQTEGRQSESRNLPTSVSNHNGIESYFHSCLASPSFSCNINSCFAVLALTLIENFIIFLMFILDFVRYVRSTAEGLGIIVFGYLLPFAETWEIAKSSLESGKLAEEARDNILSLWLFIIFFEGIFIRVILGLTKSAFAFYEL